MESVTIYTKNNSGYIKWNFSIGYFESYVNYKSDYLELLLGVHKSAIQMIKLSFFYRKKFAVILLESCILTQQILLQRLGLFFF